MTSVMSEQDAVLLTRDTETPVLIIADLLD